MSRLKCLGLLLFEVFFDFDGVFYPDLIVIEDASSQLFIIIILILVFILRNVSKT